MLLLDENLFIFISVLHLHLRQNKSFRLTATFQKCHCGGEKILLSTLLK